MSTDCAANVFIEFAKVNVQFQLLSSMDDCLWLLETLSSTVFSYTEKFSWICRETEPYTIDSDGKRVLLFHINHQSTVTVLYAKD